MMSMNIIYHLFREAMECKIRCRGIILWDGKLLVVRLKEAHDRYCLPGGKCEMGEILDEVLMREIEEELWVIPELGGIALIQELIFQGWDHNIEFFYWVKNAERFRDIDRINSSHAHELAEVRWIDIYNPDVELYPKELCEWLKWNSIGGKLGRIVNAVH